MRGRRHGGAGAAEGDVEGGEVGWNGAGAGGSDDGWLRLLKEPLDGLSVRLVSQFTRELKHSGSTRRRHADPAASAIDLGVAVLGGSPLRRRLFGLLRQVEVVISSRSSSNSSCSYDAVPGSGGTRLFCDVINVLFL